MGSLPITVKTDVRNPDRCNGCKWLTLSTEPARYEGNDPAQVDVFTARCLKFRCQVRQWSERDETPKLFPIGINCKELPESGE